MLSLRPKSSDLNLFLLTFCFSRYEKTLECFDPLISDSIACVTASK